MYNQEKQNYVGAANNILNAEVKFPMLEGNISMLFNYLNEQEGLIRQVKSKLHKIVDKNHPEKEPEPSKPVLNDIEQQFREQLNHLSQNNSMLLDVLNHISEII